MSDITLLRAATLLSVVPLITIGDTVVNYNQHNCFATLFSVAQLMNVWQRFTAETHDSEHRLTNYRV